MKEDFVQTVVLCALLCFLGVVGGVCVASDYWRQQIVDKGFAEWQIVKGTKEVEFKWKEKQ